jgi:hypothetical protein
MPQVELLAEAGAKQLVGVRRIGLLRTHRNRRISTPGGHFPAIYIFGDAKASPNSNNLPLFQSRLVKVQHTIFCGSNLE